MRRAAAAPAATALVGDSRVDLDTARNAGVQPCMAGYGFGFRFDAADLKGLHVARSPREIPACLSFLGRL
jgi:phosphoglycolate phosphatase-like HAD superfamily hydrolase